MKHAAGQVHPRQSHDLDDAENEKQTDDAENEKETEELDDAENEKQTECLKKVNTLETILNYYSRMPPADKKPLGCSLIKNGTTGALGFARPSLLAAAVAVLELVFALYGLVKYARLTHRDLIGGVRCGDCSFRPVRANCYAAAGAAALTAVALGISDLLTTRHSSWSFPCSSESPVMVVKILSLRRCIFYEVAQGLVTLISLASWWYGLQHIAQIDLPGDPMHMMYVHSGRGHASREQPWTDRNPLSVDSTQFLVLHRLELFVAWAVVLNVLLSSLERLSSKRTMYAPALWLALEVCEVGVLAGTLYPRVLDHWGWFGASVNGYSPFVACGVFRFLRVFRFERLMVSLFGVYGVRVREAGRTCDVQVVNGVYIRYYALLIKFGTVVFCTAVVVCAVEFPCAVNAVRRDNYRVLERCNPSFKRFDQCLYFLMVTLSTVGYGDMAPATQEGRLLLIGILVMILAVVPGFISEMNELSDGVDMSSNDRLFFTLAEIHHANTSERDAHSARVKVEFEKSREERLQNNAETLECLERLRRENETVRTETRDCLACLLEGATRTDNWLKALHLRLDAHFENELKAKESHEPACAPREDAERETPLEAAPREAASAYVRTCATPALQRVSSSKKTLKTPHYHYPSDGRHRSASKQSGAKKKHRGRESGRRASDARRERHPESPQPPHQSYYLDFPTVPLSASARPRPPNIIT